MGVNWGQQVRKQSGHGKIRSYRPREKNRARGWELIVSPENKIRKNKKLLFFFYVLLGQYPTCLKYVLCSSKFKSAGDHDAA